jgi:UTP--glucose-1-phosphate uridylyltransferase
MGPLARAIPKAMFPLVTAGGEVRPIIRFAIAEALSSRVETVGLIVSPDHVEMLQRYIDADDEARGTDLARRIEYILQPEPEGFGEAVDRAGDFTGDEPFLLLLGDYVFRAEAGEPSCADQVISAFAAEGGAAVVGMQAVGPDALGRCGVACGEPLSGDIYKCIRLAEKPGLAEARAKLRTPGLPPDRFLAHFGIYAFSPVLFDCLNELVETRRPKHQEIELADAQAMLLERFPEEYFLLRVRGTAIDAGTPAGYAAAQAAVRDTT